jgi:endonuclease/exonuclease/phosphatase family metal-dependent hydrolase
MSILKNMVKHVFRMALVLICTAPCMGRTTGEENMIRVLSYNIHHGEGIDGTLDLERIARVIQSASPDIVSLQEVDNRTTRSKGVDQAKELARLTGMKYAYGPSMDFGGGKYGNAVLTKFIIAKSKTIPLPGEPRSALCVTLKTFGTHLPAKEFLFIATHLDTGKTPRIDSVPLIENLFASIPDLPAIIAGDFNAIPNSPTMEAFGKTWENATSQKGLFTFPVANPSEQIDYVLCRPAGKWKVVSAKVLDEAVASDHRPILAELQYVPADGKRF